MVKRVPGSVGLFDHAGNILQGDERGFIGLTDNGFQLVDPEPVDDNTEGKKIGAVFITAPFSHNIRMTGLLSGQDVGHLHVIQIQLAVLADDVLERDRDHLIRLQRRHDAEFVGDRPIDSGEGHAGRQDAVERGR